MARPAPHADIHVNQHVDAANRRTGRADPCITVKVGRQNRYAAEVEVLDGRGAVVARVCYRPDQPLPHNGARCWVETAAPLRLRRSGQVVAVLPGGPAVVHVSKAKIRGNGAAPGQPILTAWPKGGGPVEAEEVEVLGPGGAVLATIVYSPDAPLPCGAKCWVRCASDRVRLVGEVPSPGRSKSDPHTAPATGPRS